MKKVFSLQIRIVQVQFQSKRKRAEKDFLTLSFHRKLTRTRKDLTSFPKLNTIAIKDLLQISKLA